MQTNNYLHLLLQEASSQYSILKITGGEDLLPLDIDSFYIEFFLENAE